MHVGVAPKDEPKALVHRAMWCRDNAWPTLDRDSLCSRSPLPLLSHQRVSHKKRVSGATLRTETMTAQKG